MKLSTLIRLPASLLAVSLSLLVASAPAQVTPTRGQSVDLNPDNFDVSTATGTWCVIIGLNLIVANGLQGSSSSTRLTVLIVGTLRLCGRNWWEKLQPSHQLR